MPAVFAVEDDIYVDGLGRGAPLGGGFVRRVTLTLTTADVAGTLTPAEIGADSFLAVMGVVSRTAGITAAVTALTGSSLTVTASATDSTIALFVLSRNL